MAAATSEITIEVPGDDRTLIMRAPEWALLGGDRAGWQLGGWVDVYDLDAFHALWVAEQIRLTHPDQPPALMSLRERIEEPSERIMPYGYLKIRAVDGPRPHPAWRIQGQEATV
ncbi:MAG: hypothetical protein AUG49_25240 [Catenulispora sp. 13_1_20CM_3_70_7]|nr:MAG: hypothetical protein AUG49_25240 [Catenulispora sp. 13_1_20CM_3_70_7]